MEFDRQPTSELLGPLTEVEEKNAPEALFAVNSGKLAARCARAIRPTQNQEGLSMSSYLDPAGDENYGVGTPSGRGPGWGRENMSTHFTPRDDEHFGEGHRGATLRLRQQRVRFRPRLG